MMGEVMIDDGCIGKLAREGKVAVDRPRKHAA